MTGNLRNNLIAEESPGGLAGCNVSPLTAPARAVSLRKEGDVHAEARKRWSVQKGKR